MAPAQGHCLFLFVLIHVVLKATSFSAESTRRLQANSRFRVREDQPQRLSLFSIHRRQVTTKLILLPLLLLPEVLFPVFAMPNNAAKALSPLEGTTNDDASPSIGWGIVGLGDVVAVKAGPAFYKAKGNKLVAVMRRTPGAAQAWIERNLPPNISSCRGYDHLDDFLKNSDLDAVYIATPPGAHLEIARKVAAAKKPAYIEKPVGRCGWETEAIAKAFEENGVPLFTAYVSRAYERTNAIVKLLNEGVVGDCITSIKYKLQGSEMARGLDWSSSGALPWRLNATLAGGGLVMDVGCHVVDRIDYLCGPLINVQGKACNRKSSQVQNVEDLVELTAEIGSCDWAAINSEGATVKCIWDFSSSESLDELTISGPDGALQMAAMSPFLPIRILGPDGKVVRQVTFEPPQHAAQPLIQIVVDELRGIPGAVSPSRGDNALRTSKVLDKALDSCYGGREDEFWTRPDTWPGRQQGGDAC